MNQTCFNCDAVMEPNMMHNCIRGITENINRLHSNLNQLRINKLDHLEGLVYVLKIIENLEFDYQAMGISYKEEMKDPFHDMKNEIRMHLGLRLVMR